MQTVRIAIVGGGLSGLYAAYLLEQKGIKDYVLLEARNTLGGRIKTTSADNQQNRIDRFDLGPTWYWPLIQRQLENLILELGLKSFQQYETGDMLVERSQDASAIRTPGYLYSPISMRLVGGMSSLIEALQSHLEPICLITDRKVFCMRTVDQHIELDTEDASGHFTQYRAGHVLLAMPPRLVDHNIEFMPALPSALQQQWRDAPTWMAPHAKYIAIYEHAFWREQGLSGEARSERGPLGEIHDASMPGGSAALFGFFAAPARVRKGVTAEVMRTLCRAQLTRLFGPNAATPKAELIKDWAWDPFTATATDLESVSQHAEAPPASVSLGPWRGRITGIASEWSPQYPGYVAGAVEAAHLGVQSILKHSNCITINPPIH